MENRRILLHACCAPCSIKCVEVLEQEGIVPTLFWYNPNIHPFTEYESRRETLRTYAETVGLDVVWDEALYGLRCFLTEIGSDFDARCEVCYRMRMEAAARYAQENGFDGFSTTLQISPYQDQERLCALASRAAERYGIEFLRRDFRPWFRAGQQAARDMGLYRQKYCGCIFSEEERYKKNLTQ